MMRLPFFVLLIACLAAAPKRVAAPATKNAAPVDDPSPMDQPESPDAPVPYLSGEEAIRTFQLPPGFRAELVAQ